MISQSYNIIKKLRVVTNGLYRASVGEYYRDYTWIRDNVYISLPFIDKTDGFYEKTFHTMLDMFKYYEDKLTYHTVHKPQEVWQYPHSRYTAEDVKEIHDQEWGHAQHDAIGAFLFGIGEGIKHHRKVIRNKHDLIIIQKLVNYLGCIEYWHDPDNGMWEESREIHMSSVGACVAGLVAVGNIVEVPYEYIANGHDAIYKMFPCESNTKRIDLSQLSLIYPYRLFNKDIADVLVKHVEYFLLRGRGVIRYEGDSYYSTLEEKIGRDHSKETYFGTEGEWTFGLPWLALCHMELGNIEKAKEYIKWTESVMLEDGALPELYYSKTDIPNPNTPLGWSNALYIVAKETIEQM